MHPTNGQARALSRATAVASRALYSRISRPNSARRPARAAPHAASCRSVPARRRQRRELCDEALVAPYASRRRVRPRCRREPRARRRHERGKRREIGARPAATAAIIAAPIAWHRCAPRHDAAGRARRRGSAPTPGSARRRRATRPRAPQPELAEPHDDVARGEREALEHGASDVCALVAGREPVQRAARVRAATPASSRRRAPDERDASGAGRCAPGQRVELRVARQPSMWVAQRTAPPDIQPGFSTKNAPVGNAWVSTIGSAARSSTGVAASAPTTSAVPIVHSTGPGATAPAPSGDAKSSPVPTATGVPATRPVSRAPSSVSAPRRRTRVGSAELVGRDLERIEQPPATSARSPARAASWSMRAQGRSPPRRSAARRR